MADAHAVPHHDYHLVNPSPWPLVSSIAVVIMMVGAVVWMKGLVPAESGPLASALQSDGKMPLFFAGLAGVLVSMFGWWADVIKESKAGDHTPVVSIGLRYGMILFIASEIMFFAAFFWMFFEMAVFNEEALNSGLYGSIFFMATGFHGFHVLIGTIFLIVCLLRLLAGQMTPQKHFGFEAAARYWHFVDVVWLFLFAFVYVAPHLIFGPGAPAAH